MGETALSGRRAAALKRIRQLGVVVCAAEVGAAGSLVHGLTHSSVQRLAISPELMDDTADRGGRAAEAIDVLCARLRAGTVMRDPQTYNSALAPETTETPSPLTAGYRLRTVGRQVDSWCIARGKSGRCRRRIREGGLPARRAKVGAWAAAVRRRQRPDSPAQYTANLPDTPPVLLRGF